MTSSLLDQLLDPLAQSFTAQQARQILDWHLDTEGMKRLELLRERANEGSLSEEDDVEYKRLIEDLDVAALIQAKARQTLAKNAA